MRPAGAPHAAVKGMGSSRGNVESGFIRSVDDAARRFYATVVAQSSAATERDAFTAVLCVVSLAVGARPGPQEASS
ncbi:hypothetical protein SNL152K_4740 [Streptomyces sp. NL15-2K]|nr:hypothetical protein [Kutzneria buriramensis]WKX11083.1 hypothetical protein Q4V64_27660 [Kutzneria buriramensis]GCB47435.1 hypothetical protein SNL152K_4740 [Streptomyces sp. NL15-2K]